MPKCEYCSIDVKIPSLWGSHKLCHSCTTRVYTIWQAEYIKKMYPGIETLVPNQEMDDIVNVPKRKKELLLDYWGLDKTL